MDVAPNFHGNVSYITRRELQQQKAEPWSIVKLNFLQIINEEMLKYAFSKVTFISNCKWAEEQFFDILPDHIQLFDMQFFTKEFRPMRSEKGAVLYSVKHLLATFPEYINNPATEENRHNECEHRALGDSILEFRIVCAILLELKEDWNFLLKHLENKTPKTRTKTTKQPQKQKPKPKPKPSEN